MHDESNSDTRDPWRTNKRKSLVWAVRRTFLRATVTRRCQEEARGGQAGPVSHRPIGDFLCIDESWIFLPSIRIGRGTGSGMPLIK